MMSFEGNLQNFGQAMAEPTGPAPMPLVNGRSYLMSNILNRWNYCGLDTPRVKKLIYGLWSEYPNSFPRPFILKNIMLFHRSQDLSRYVTHWISTNLKGEYILINEKYAKIINHCIYFAFAIRLCLGQMLCPCQISAPWAKVLVYLPGVLRREGNAWNWLIHYLSALLDLYPKSFLFCPKWTASWKFTPPSKWNTTHGSWWICYILELLSINDCHTSQTYQIYEVAPP